MPPFTYEYKGDIFYIKDTAAPTNIVRAHYPEDGQNRPAAVVMGFEYATGKFIPIASTPDGKLETTATMSGSVTIGAVTIEDRNSSTRLDVMKGDGTAEFNLAGDHVQGILTFGVGRDGKVRAILQSNAGAISTDENPMGKTNMAQRFTWVTVAGMQKPATLREYPQGAIVGAPAKLTTFTWNLDGTLDNSVTTDALVIP